MKVKFTLSIGFPTAKQEDIVEFNDDITDEELEIEWQSWAWNYISGGFTKSEEC